MTTRTRRRKRRRPIDIFKPKTTSRRQKKAAKYKAERPDARAEAYRRDMGRCVWPTCQKRLMLNTDSVTLLAHAHELLGGRSKVDATNVDMMVTVCSDCHADLHVRIGGKRKRIDGTVAGAEGPLRFFERQRKRDDAGYATTEWEWIEVTA